MQLHAHMFLMLFFVTHRYMRWTGTYRTIGIHLFIWLLSIPPTTILTPCIYSKCFAMVLGVYLLWCVHLSALCRMVSNCHICIMKTFKSYSLLILHSDTLCACLQKYYTALGSLSCTCKCMPSSLLNEPLIQQTLVIRSLQAEELLLPIL